MLLNRRTLLNAAASCVAVAGGLRLLSTCAFAAPANAVSLPQYRQPRDRGDSEALARALATGLPVQLPARQGSGPSGEYMLEDVILDSGAQIFGDGQDTVLVPARNQARHIMKAVARSPAEPLVGIHLANFRIEGAGRSIGFNQHWNLLDFAGVEDVRIENVHFRAFPSDAIMFAGEGTGAGGRGMAARHNRRIVVRGCSFDGVDRNNRNAISILDGDGVTIENCSFRNCTRPDMPGAIDIEPSPYPFYRIASITVSGCTFENCGGTNGAISVFIPPEVAAAPHGIQILNNQFVGNAAPDIFVNIRGGRADQQDHAIVIDGNRGSGGKAPWAIFAARGVTIGSGNHWQDYAAGAALGYTQPGDRVERFSDRATYERVGRAGPPSPFGLAVFNVDGATFGGSFIDCGDGSAESAAIAFINAGARNVAVDGARFSASDRRARYAVRALVALPRGAVRQGNNQFGGLEMAVQ